MKNNNFFRKFFKSSILVLLLAFGLFIFACNDEDTTPTNPFVDGVYEEITELFNEDAIAENLLIPSSYKGVNVSFESSNTDIIANNGKVTRPEEDTFVTLTFKLNYQGVEYVKTIQVIVLAKGAVVPTYYTVSLPQDSNGTVEASKTTNILEGEAVSIRVTPNAGYKLDWIKANGVALDVRDNEASIIVTANVVVTVSFISENSQGGGDNTTLVWSPATEFTAGETYKFGLFQTANNQTLYLNGSMTGYYMSTTENPDEAIDVTVVQVTGGYQLKTTIAGATKYIEAVTSSDGAHVNAVYSSSPTVVWRWNDEYDTFVTEATKESITGDYFLGTYDNKITFGASDLVKYASSSYIGHLYYQKEVASEELTSAQKLENIKEDLNEILGLAGSKLTSNITFPTTSLYDSTIIWSTSDSSVVSLDGVVNTALTTKTTVTLGYQIVLDGTEYDYVYFVVYVGGEDSYIAYYNGINGQTGNQLLLALRDIITKTHSKKTSYDDCKTKKYVMATDGNAAGTKIVLFWSGIEIDWVWDGGTSWNREHVWPQSQGWFTTSGAGSDLHHIRPVDSSVNSSHGNNPYGIVSGGKFCVTSSANGKVTTQCKVGGGKFEPVDSRKGDTARIIFYLLTRYPEADSYPISRVATSMSMLLEWNASDPVDASEIRRNEAVKDIQGNRNPFIDYPEFANMIWGTSNRSLGRQSNTVSIKLNRVAGQYQNVLYF